MQHSWKKCCGNEIVDTKCLYASMYFSSIGLGKNKTELAEIKCNNKKNSNKIN